MTTDIQKLILAGQRNFRRVLAQDATESAKRLVNAYRNVLGTVEEQLRDLRILAQAEGMTTQALRNEATLIRLRDAIQEALGDLVVVIEREADQLQDNGIRAGSVNAQITLDATVRGLFSQPSIEQLKALINYVDSPAFRSAVTHYADHHSQAVVDIVVAGVASGKHPTTVARAISKYISNYPLHDALRMTRTVQIWSARRSTHETFKANRDVVNGWVWVSAGDSRTCMGCLGMHGKRFDLDDVLNDHHLGRCAPVPITKSWAELGFSSSEELTPIISGEQLFTQQFSEQDQRRMMGTSRWNAWKDGLFNFDQLSTTYTDNVYGEMRKAASLEMLVGQQVAREYRVRSAA